VKRYAHLAVEGLLDEMVLRRMLADAGIEVLAVHGHSGKPHLRKCIDGYNRAAQFGNWIVVADLDDEPCAPTMVRRWLPKRGQGMCLRIAVRAIEAWLLADHMALARYLAVSPILVPRQPDALSQPKQAMVVIAAKSRQRQIRDGMVPDQGSGRTIGKRYNSILAQFARQTNGGWNPKRAARNSDSLRRALRAISALR
jgi:hypothetical protein